MCVCVHMCAHLCSSAEVLCTLSLLFCPPHKLVGRAFLSASSLLCRSNGITGMFYRASGLYIGSEDLNSGLHAFMTNRLALSPLPSTNFHS